MPRAKSDSVLARMDISAPNSSASRSNCDMSRPFAVEDTLAELFAHDRLADDAMQFLVDIFSLPTPMQRTLHGR